jgi:hypothetical protein
MRLLAVPTNEHCLFVQSYTDDFTSLVLADRNADTSKVEVGLPDFETWLEL